MQKAIIEKRASMNGLYQYLERKPRTVEPCEGYSNAFSFASVPITAKDAGRYHPPIEVSSAVNYGRGKGPVAR